MGIFDALYEFFYGFLIVNIFEVVGRLIPRPKRIIPVTPFSTACVFAIFGYFALLAYIFKTGLYNSRLLLIVISSVCL